MSQDASAPEDSAQAHALVVLGGLTLAIPVSQVDQAVPRPLGTSPLPRTRQTLAGAFEHRGQMVPVVDLRGCYPGHPWQGEEPRQALILRCGGRVIGLAIERVQGIQPLACRQIVRLHHDDDGGELFHSVARIPSQPEPVGLLDVERLTGQLHVWASTEADLPADGGLTSVSSAVAWPQKSSHAGIRELRCALLSASGIDFGLEARDVGEVLPLPPLQRVFAPAGGLLGITRWRGRDLPVVDVAALLDLAPVRTLEPPWLAIVQANGLCVGVGVDAIDALQTFRAEAVGDAALAGLPRPALYMGVAAHPAGGLRHLLNTAALIAACPGSDLSRAQRQDAVSTAIGLAAPLSAEGPGQAIEDHAYVVLRAGGLWAAPLEDMAEITPFPGDVLPVADGPAAQVGVFTWRGQSLPLLDLQAAQAGQRTAASRLARVVIWRRGRQHMGLAVDEVLELLPARTALRTRVPLGRGRHLHMLTTGRGLAQGSYRVLDLQALVS